MSVLQPVLLQEKSRKSSQEMNTSSILESVFDSRNPKRGPDKEVLQDPIQESEHLQSEDDEVSKENSSRPERSEAVHHEDTDVVSVGPLRSSKETRTASENPSEKQHVGPRFDARTPKRGPDKEPREDLAQTSDNSQNGAGEIGREANPEGEIQSRVYGSVGSGQTGCSLRRLETRIWNRTHHVEPRFDSRKPKRGPDKRSRIQRTREQKINQPAKRNGNGPRERN